MTAPPSISPPRPAWKTPLIVFGVVTLVALITAAILWWWLNRPITPVTLSAPEKAVVQQKIEALSGDPPEFAISPGTVSLPDGGGPAADPVPEYEPGGKSIIFTQRELNGLLEMNGLGEQVKIVLGNDAVIARVNADIPEDFPALGGRKFKARARFLVADQAGNPALIVDDLTVWGISMPNAWLGDIKGENLFELISPDLNDNFIARGIKDIRVDAGQIVIDLAD